MPPSGPYRSSAASRIGPRRSRNELSICLRRALALFEIGRVLSLVRSLILGEWMSADERSARIAAMKAQATTRISAGEQMTKHTDESSNFGAEGPFFRIIREGLEGLVDGEDYSTFWPTNVIVGVRHLRARLPQVRQGAAKRHRPLRQLRRLHDIHTADNLRVYRDPEASVVVLEYEVHGQAVQTGRPYNNRFVSIITVKDGKVTHWRDYLDPIAVFDAAGWPNTPT